MKIIKRLGCYGEEIAVLLLGLTGVVVTIIGLGLIIEWYEGTPRVEEIKNPYADIIQTEINRVDAELEAAKKASVEKRERLKKLYGKDWKYYWYDGDVNYM